MTTSSTAARKHSGVAAWLRKCHRWVGAIAAVFVLLLAATGIALNHSADWRLDRQYVNWDWLLDAYGITAPAPSASYADADHRAVLLGQRLYFDAREIARNIDRLTGLVSLNAFVVLSSADGVFLVTAAGDLVEHIDLTSQLPASIDRLGLSGDRIIVSSGGTNFRSDAEVNNFEAWRDVLGAAVAWSAPSGAPMELLAKLEEQYRGQGLTVERVLADLHSGRIVSTPGPLFMDFIAVCLVFLSATGILFWVRGSRRDNGSG